MTSNVTATATSHISFIFILGEGGRNMIILTTQRAAGVQNDYISNGPESKRPESMIKILTEL